MGKKDFGAVHTSMDFCSFGKSIPVKVENKYRHLTNKNESL